MDKRLEIAQAKELRAEIINTLYEFFGESTSLNTVKTLLRYKSYYSDKDVWRAVSYLAGTNKNYVHLETDAADQWNSIIQLTPTGVNLAEGDIKDAGVLLDE